MSFGAGSFVRAARSHEAAGVSCEDAAAARGGAEGFCVVCDGCSGGVGSGLAAAALAGAAMACFEQGARDELARLAWSRTLRALSWVGADATRGPATLVALSARPGEGGKALVRATLWGDGVVAWGSAAHGLRGAWVGSSPSGIPGYPAYAFDDEVWERARLEGAGSAWAALEGFEGGPLPAGRGWEGSFELEPGEVALALSDGVLAIEGVSAREALEGLLGARGPGDFLQRRARKALDQWRVGGAALGDDFGVAALRWEPDSD